MKVVLKGKMMFKKSSMIYRHDFLLNSIIHICMHIGYVRISNYVLYNFLLFKIYESSFILFLINILLSKLTCGTDCFVYFCFVLTFDLIIAWRYLELISPIIIILPLVAPCQLTAKNLRNRLSSKESAFWESCSASYWNACKWKT